MARRMYAPIVTIPIGTLSAAPQRTDLSWPPGIVERIECRVPPGPSGMVGFAIGHSGQIIIPRGAQGWIITDDESLSWDMDGYPTGDKWFISAYNEGLYEHKLYFRFFLSEIADPGFVAVEPIIVGPDMDVVSPE